MEYVIKNNKPLFIIADVEPQVLAALAMNKMKGNIKVCIVDAPVFGFTKKEKLNDLALMTGATVINEDLGDDMDLIDPNHLGKAKKVISNKDNTIIQVEETPEAVKDLIEEIQTKQAIEKIPGYKIAHERRLALLAAKVAVVKVGAHSEIELKEKSDRVEDAICAMPEKDGFGIDVVTGNMVNMIDSGIIDPLLVTKSALVNAASVASTILSTDCIINNIRIHESDRK